MKEHVEYQLPKKEQSTNKFVNNKNIDINNIAKDNDIMRLINMEK